MTIGLGASSNISFAHFPEDLCFFRPALEFLCGAGAKVPFSMPIPPFFLMFLALLCGQANLASIPSSFGTVPNQVPGSESATTTPGTCNADEYCYSVLQTRCARLEQDLRATQGVLAVLWSKQPRPAEQEAFLLEELDRANSNLLYKLSRSPRAVKLSISSRVQLLSSFDRCSTGCAG